MAALAGEKVVAVAAGEYHVLALTDSGAVYAWGAGGDGQTGHGVKTDVLAPRPIDSFKEPIAIVAAGGGHSACVTSTGKLFLFGRGRSGQLGRGDSLESVASARTTPVAVDALAGLRVRAVALGADHTVAVTQ